MSDASLAHLVSGLDQSYDQTVTMTVWVGGAVVAGVAVGQRLFWDELSVAVRQSPGDDGSGLADTFEQWAVDETARSMDPSPEGEPAAPDFVHLVDAHMIVDGEPAGRSMHWRSHLSAIDAWSVTRVAEPER